MNGMLTRLQEWPRTSFVREPTPLIQAPNLAQTLGRTPADVLLKMDAESGFALGGNKARKLEFELAPDRLKGATHVITCGGPQSNHARLTAAAAARLGLKCVLVVNGDTPPPHKGNAYLHRLFGAEIRPVATQKDRDPTMAEVAAEVEADGGHALVIPLGASTPLGSLGYVRAATEIDAQLRDHPHAGDTWIFVSASSCGTYAGLALGFTLLERTDVRLVGVSADISRAEILDLTERLATRAGELLGAHAPLLTGLLHPTDDYVGPGYGIHSDASEEATALLGRTEGVLLDPAYTAKTAAAMLDWAQSGRIPREDRMILWHTGGYPTALAL
ncbi:MAG: pyridoxal-phosphate dependent enzyme [Gemmatimonadetes bacterium]|nr:pyridoxal-phosphate dependent enzyme [Gemmatimonadota bacterium]